MTEFGGSVPESDAWGVETRHTSSLDFQHISSKLCLNWLAIEGALLRNYFGASALRKICEQGESYKAMKATQCRRDSSGAV